MESAAATPVKVPDLPTRRPRTLFRIAGVAAVFLLMGFLSRYATAAMERNPAPAGFLRGVAQGALMPLALPNLAIGRDVAIYASHNTGVSYKLGYTVGVNACGALFFGFFFWRVSRWRKRGVKRET